MAEIITIIILSLLIVAQALERYFYSKQMTEKLSECLRAVMSRNINEFITATAVSKAPREEFSQTDEVSLDEVSEEIFDKMVSDANK